MYVYAGHVQHLVAHNGGFTVAGRWTLQHVDRVPEANEYALTPQVRLYLDQLVGLWRNVSTVSGKLGRYSDGPWQTSADSCQTIGQTCLMQAVGQL